MLTAAGALEAEPCSGGALRSDCLGLPAWLPGCGCLLAGEAGGEGSLLISMCQAGCQEWTAGHNGAPRHVSIELLILATDTEDNSRPGTAVHECRPDTVALFVRAEWERAPPRAGVLLSVQSITPFFFWQWGRMDRHRDLACGNRETEPYCFSPALAAGADSPLPGTTHTAFGPRFVAVKVYATTSDRRVPKHPPDLLLDLHTIQ